MREDLRRKLREISVSLSTPKFGVTGVTDPVTPPQNTVLHRPLHLMQPEKAEAHQRCNTVTPVTPLKTEGGENCYTETGDTGGVTPLPEVELQPPQPLNCIPEDWLAHFEERAAIREFEGGFDRVEAERLALDDTVAAFGPGPQRLPIMQ